MTRLLFAAVLFAVVVLVLADSKASLFLRKLKNRAEKELRSLKSFRRDDCDDSCEFSFDDFCDDGSPGSVTDFCDSGTDCTDCSFDSDCDNSCELYAFDDECDDGGPGSVTDLCEFGTDCYDCILAGLDDSLDCNNTCEHAYDQECDDGGPGSVSLASRPRRFASAKCAAGGRNMK
ncbi:uncharacterized protein [Ptychodera flava]|uniref:uncharacterized protein n=1 Tax=Ptychodera flava TaxID=63121 RepID=UPI003969E156